MKKLFLMGLFMIIAVSLQADMVYDPVTDSIYSVPQSPDINPAEYACLFYACGVIKQNIKLGNGGTDPSFKDLLNQVSIYLKKIGTPTALRLLSDLKKNKVFYPDGSVMRYMCN